VQLTSDAIYGFAGSLLSQRFDDATATPDCHREWWDLCCSPHKRVAIAAPRGHAKSTAITKAFTLASVLFRAHDYVLVISDTYKQAVLFLGEIKLELANNDDLRQLFGIKDFLTDREDDIIVLLEDGHMFRLMALGSEQKVRGLLWNGKRPNLVIGDDLENDEIVMNPERRDKFRGWFFNALLPALSKKGKVRLVGTILHMDALLERLMPRDIDSNTEQEPLKSYMKKPLNGWMSVRYRAHDDKYKHVLWPERFSEAYLKEIRAMVISQGNPEGYYQEYLNKPIDPENSFFKKDDLLPFDERDYERDWGYSPTFLAADLAVTTKQKRDYCAFGIGSIDEKGQFYLRHVVHERMDTKDQVETIDRLQQRFKFNTMLIGKGALEKAIGPFLLEQLNRKDRFLHIEAIPENEDKRMRAQSIRGRMRAGGVKFNKKPSWYLEFEKEMLEFDRGTHDDQVDMMSLFGMYLDSMVDAPAAKEIEQMIWEEENLHYLEQEADSGRCPLTGY
jgi:predicted phage terminase large subunit-like protein